MLALKIIGGIVLFFCLLMLIPVGARAIYSEDGLFLWFKIACFSIRLVPMRKKKDGRLKEISQRSPKRTDSKSQREARRFAQSRRRRQKSPES